jgi:formylglycine-generating enzyme required for sulfatase activity
MTVRVWAAVLACLGLTAPALADDAPLAPGPGGGTKYALLIGVDNYTNESKSKSLRPLKFAQRDAHRLRSILKGQGYKVILMTENEAAETGDSKLKPTCANIEAKLGHLLGKNGKGGVIESKQTVLIVMTGHGFQLEGDSKNRDFFAPANAVPSLLDTDTLISLNDVIDRLGECPAEGKMLIVDACRTMIGKSGKEIAPLNPDQNPKVPNDVCVLFGCKTGQKSFEDEKLKHGLTSFHVIEALSKYGEPITWKAMSRQVRDGVSKAVKVGDQDPIDLTPDPDKNPVILTLSKPIGLVVPFPEDKAQEFQKLWASRLGRKQPVVEIPLDPNNRVLLKVVLIPPGEFTMGASEKDGGTPDDTPHHVTLTRHYFMGQFEITQQQFDTITGRRNKFDKVGPELPASGISFADAEQFCLDVTKLLKANKAWPTDPLEAPLGYECRLPSEAEWEYACRAGTATKFYLGQELPQGQANCAGFVGEPVKVGGYPKNPFGLYDMHGNVAEWCSDWYAPYDSTPAVNPTGPESSVVFKKKALRGSGYNAPVKDCRSAARSSYRVTGDNTADIVGFRVVIAPRTK